MPDLGDYEVVPYREPGEVGPPFIPLTAPGNQSWTIQIDFPPSAGSLGPVTYWLTGDEDMTIEIQLARGTQALRESESVLLMLFLDGRQQSLLDGQGQPQAVLRYQMPAGTVIHERIVVPHAQIPTGAHSVVLAAMGARGEMLPSWSFSVLKDGTAFGQRDAVTGTRGKAIAGQGPDALITGGTDVFDGRANLGPGGTLPVRFVIQVQGDCPQIPRHRALLAALDGQQIPVGDLGLAPHVALTVAERVELPTVFSGLVDDGRPHGLALWLVSDGEYMEAPRGRVAKGASFPKLVGRAWWGGQ